MKYKIGRKVFPLGIVLLFIGTGFVPNSGGRMKGLGGEKTAGLPEYLGCGNSQTVIPTDDSYIDTEYPNQNFNYHNWLQVGDYGHPIVAISRTYLKFDLSSIPPGSTINSAVLSLFIEGYNSPMDVGVHYFDDDSWLETTITWNTPYIGLFEMIPTDVTTISSNGWYGWDVTPDVQTTVDSNAVLSEVLKATTEMVQYKGCSFPSREYGVYYPCITIDYCLPGTMALDLPRGFHRSLSFNLILTNNAGKDLNNVHWQISWTAIGSFPPNYPPGSTAGIVNIPLTTGSVTVSSGLLPTLGAFGLARIQIQATADCATPVTRRGALLWFGANLRFLIIV